jgi:hypothetical protein
MKAPEGLASSDALMQKINTTESRKVDPKIASLPRVRYPTTLRTVADAVRRAFLKHATQPTFRVISTKPNLWHVDGFHYPEEDRVSFREFTPGVRSMKLKNRMYWDATFANVRLVCNAILAAVLDEFVVRRRANPDHEEIMYNDTTSCKTHVFLAPCSDPTRWDREVRLVWEDEAQLLDNGKGVHLTVWVYLNGGGWAEIDATVMHGIMIEKHVEAPNSAVRMLAETGLAQSRLAMEKRNEAGSLEAALSDAAVYLEEIQEEIKKERTRERRRRREKSRKEKKRLARAAGTPENVEDASGNVPSQ